MPAMPTVSASGVTADASRRACERVLATARNPPAPDSPPTGVRAFAGPRGPAVVRAAPRPAPPWQNSPSATAGASEPRTDLVVRNRAPVPATASTARDAADHAQPGRWCGRGGEGFDRPHLPCATTGDVRRDLTGQQCDADGDDHRDPTGIDLERPRQQTRALAWPRPAAMRATDRATRRPPPPTTVTINVSRAIIRRTCRGVAPIARNRAISR